MKYSLKELRARLGLTQAEMAEKLGISTQTYNSSHISFYGYLQGLNCFGI